MTRQLIIIFLLLTGSIHLLAQNFDLSKKSHGAVITSKNDTTTGEIVIGSDWQSIFLIGETGSKQLSAAQFISMEINSDQFAGKYISSSITSEGKLYIFKVITEGSVKLLSFQGNSEIEKGFYTSEEDRVKKLVQKNFYNVFGKFKKIMKDYVFSHALDIKNSNDLTQIFDYYNKNLL